MAEEIHYAKAGGPPDDWWNWQVFDADTGEEVRHVIEVNIHEGWLVRHVTEKQDRLVIDSTLPFGQPMPRLKEALVPTLRTERVEGRFILRRRECANA